MSATNNLAGLTALITGSTSGIGLAIAQALAKAEANIILNGFGSKDEVCALLSTFTKNVLYHPADMSQPQEIEALFDFTKSAFQKTSDNLGGVDILINNAGIQHVASVENFPLNAWNDIIAINLSAAFHTTRLALPQMRAKNWGRIINIASVHGLVASKEKAAYVAAKHGLIGFTKTVALETASTNITCNAICPGWVLTPLVEKQIYSKADNEKISFEKAKKELLLEKQPSGEFISLDAIAQLVLFLCSNAASQIKGSAINIDGGWLAQ